MLCFRRASNEAPGALIDLVLRLYQQVTGRGRICNSGRDWGPSAQLLPFNRVSCLESAVCMWRGARVSRRRRNVGPGVHDEHLMHMEYGCTQSVGAMPQLYARSALATRAMSLESAQDFRSLARAQACKMCTAPQIQYP